MKRLGCVVFLIILFNAFIVGNAFNVGAYEPSSSYNLPDPPLPEIPEIKKVDPPNYTLEIFMISVGVTIVAAAVYLYWKEKKKLPKSQIREKSFSRNTNFAPYIQFGIYPPTREQKYVPSLRAGIRF